MKILPVLATIGIVLHAASADAATCKRGAVYESSGSGATVIVKRFGIGKSDFTRSGRLQQGMALDFVLADGQRGAIFGPMRSVMFPTDQKTLARQHYRWVAPQADPGGFFRVLSDDGQSERFTLYFVACVR